MVMVPIAGEAASVHAPADFGKFDPVTLIEVSTVPELGERRICAALTVNVVETLPWGTSMLSVIVWETGPAVFATVTLPLNTPPVDMLQLFTVENGSSGLKISGVHGVGPPATYPDPDNTMTVLIAPDIGMADKVAVTRNWAVVVSPCGLPVNVRVYVPPIAEALTVKPQLKLPPKTEQVMVAGENRLLVGPEVFANETDVSVGFQPVPVTLTGVPGGPLFKERDTDVTLNWACAVSPWGLPVKVRV